MTIEDTEPKEAEPQKKHPYYDKLPKGWQYVMSNKAGGEAYFNRPLGLRVVVFTEIETDNLLWVHVSISRRNRMPEYKDVHLIKHLFIGDDRKAIQIFPPKGEAMSEHPFCHHLFCCVSGDHLETLPKFAGV